MLFRLVFRQQPLLLVFESSGFLELMKQKSLSMTQFDSKLASDVPCSEQTMRLMSDEALFLTAFSLMLVCGFQFIFFP